jgi:hypothetical protein
MGLVFFMFVGAIIIGVMMGWNKYVRVEGCLPGPLDSVPIHDVERHLTKGQSLALAWFFLLELIIIVVALESGKLLIHQAV